MTHVKTVNYVRIIIYSTKKKTLASNFEHNIFFQQQRKTMTISVSKHWLGRRPELQIQWHWKLNKVTLPWNSQDRENKQKDPVLREKKNLQIHNSDCSKNIFSGLKLIFAVLGRKLEEIKFPGKLENIGYECMSRWRQIIIHIYLIPWTMQWQ